MATPQVLPPNPTLLVNNYREVAVKHYEAIRMMYGQLNITSGANSPKYRNLLYDAYYLSGYVLEAASVYKIFKNINWKDSKEIPAKGTRFSPLLDAHNYNNGVVHFTRSDAESFQQNLRSHNFMKYTMTRHTGCSTEPFFCGDCDPDLSNTNPICPELLKIWNADKRYYCESLFNTPGGATINGEMLLNIINFFKDYIIKII